MTTLPLAGVIGDPVGHSRSPRLFAHWFSAHHIQGYYVPLHIAPGNFGSCVRRLPQMGFRGVNVTLPHKEAALILADDVTDRARRIGAANTLTFQPDGRLHADNTDGAGFLANLYQTCPRWSATDGPALVLGAGGAARAIVVALLDAGAGRILIANRTVARAELLAADLGPLVEAAALDEVSDRLGAFSCVVNTTSLGMAGQPPLALPLDGLDPAALVTDIVYTPLETPFLRAAAARGCRVVDGLGMLLHQAVPGFERWFGQRPEVTPQLRTAVLGYGP